MFACVNVTLCQICKQEFSWLQQVLLAALLMSHWFLWYYRFFICLLAMF